MATLLYLDAVARGDIEISPEQKLKFVVLRLEPNPDEELRDCMRRLALALTRVDSQVHDIKAKAKKVWAFVQRFEAAGVKIGGAPSSNTQIALDDFADSVCDFLETLGDQHDGLLLVIDEADRATNCDFGRFCKLLTERVQRSAHNKLSIVLAGLPSTAELLVKSHESSLRIFKRIELAPLKEADRKQVVRAGLAVAEKKGEKVEISDAALDLIAEISDGYPQFIQQFAHSAFDATKDNLIDAGDVRNALPEAISQLASKYFKGPVLQEIFSDDYRTVLSALSQSSDGWVTTDQIRERTKLKDSQIRNALKTLKTKQLIVPKDGDRGVYRLPNKAFAIWITVALKSSPASIS